MKIHFWSAIILLFKENQIICYKPAKRLFNEGLDNVATHALQCGETIFKMELGPEKVKDFRIGWPSYSEIFYCKVS